MTTPPSKKIAPFWHPLRHRVYRRLWLASLASNTGIFVHGVVAGWLMTRLTSSTLLVSLVQAATALPVFLLGLPAGALADSVDRRRYLLAMQAWMIVVSLLLCAFTMSGWMSASLLLALMFAVGAGAAMMLPAWAATVPSLVPREELPLAAALNNVGMNGARAIGPAVGGAVMAQAGAGPAFLLAAAAFAVVLAVLLRWRHVQEKSRLPAEPFPDALRAGLRFAAHSPRVRAALVRSTSFVFFAAAPWALLPMVVRYRLHAEVRTYGILLAAVGAGAVLGAFVLPHARARWSNNVLVRAATALYALIAVVLAWVPDVYAAGAAALFFGAIWTCVVSSLQTAAQLYAPPWVKARTLAIFSVVFQGSLALGSAAWGWLADHAGLPAALSTAGAGAVAAAVLTRSWRLVDSDPKSVTPSCHLAPPVVAPEHGDIARKAPIPVLVTVQYQVEARCVEDFREVMRIVARSRKRNGAMQWSLFEDAEQPGRWLECFSCASWTDYLRQNERMMETDRMREEKILGCLTPGTAPRISRYLGQHA